MCAPPSSGFSPLASSTTPGGAFGDTLSVSWPDAPPGQRPSQVAGADAVAGAGRGRRRPSARRPARGRARRSRSRSWSWPTASSGAEELPRRCMRRVDRGVRQHAAEVAVVGHHAAVGSSSTSQSMPLPPRYASRPPRSTPSRQPLVHRPRPVLRVGAEHQHAVAVEVELAARQLRLAPHVVRQALAVEPRQQAPLGGRDVLGAAPRDQVQASSPGSNMLSGSGRSNDSGSYWPPSQPGELRVAEPRASSRGVDDGGAGSGRATM